METREIRRIFYRDGYRLGHAHLDQELSPRTLKEAIGQLYQAVDGLLESFLERSASEGVPAACKKGCAWCCHQAVYAVTHEFLYLQAHVLQNLSGRQQEAILKRSGEKASLTAGRTEADPRNNRVACPFLEKGSCTVYPARPMACRIYLSSSVRSCKNAYDRPGTGTSIPELYEFPLTAGRMLNEGFVAYLKQRGLRSGEWTIEQGYVSLVTLGLSLEGWIGESDASA